jgi:ribosome-associated protein
LFLQHAYPGCRQLISTEPNHDGGASRRERSIRHACLFARIADEYRGRDTIVLDLTAVTPIFDFFVLTTATSTRQMRAIADEVARAAASDRPSTEGTGTSWLLEDFGDVVVHVFSPEARSLYDLEHLWADAVRVDWQAYLESSRSA